MTPPVHATADLQDSVRQCLKECCRGEFLRKIPGAVYDGKEDFVLQHGEWFTPQRLPKPHRRRPAKECFANAYELVKSDPALRYAEGMAVPDHGKAPSMPLHHAWVVDAAGRVIDPTWIRPGLAYLGVVFPLERVAAAWSTDNQSVLDDWVHRWPLLCERYELSRWGW